ncbi:hypothetical protein F442_15275 [Phytophthora nicotianae P10297]|uniref:Uncharacterized protein n=2 Tax=Phytophthora nicotianae TaxID=4792 RepID=W2YPJ0_PHYNI|nr:hypothetical protein L915_14987 [Phytophthora nicotianae]ETL32560.1 hypothetical protein L916_14888 [Phytophthora nicotianae]ETP36866.1 hypothetical protein F442_15275 [Phytophthora nicotianae P10297]
MYMHATRQVLVVKEVIGVARRNTTLENLIQYKDATVEKIPLIPDDMAHISESTFVPTTTVGTNVLGLRTSGRQASARHTTFAGLSVLSSSKRRSITWMMARGESFWRAKFSVTTTRFLQKFTSTIQVFARYLLSLHWYPVLSYSWIRRQEHQVFTSTFETTRSTATR